MNNSIIYERVSIRRYKDQPVEEDKIMEMLRAAMQAPSAANQQPWEFYIVTDKKLLAQLSEASAYAKMTKDAPCAVVSAYRRDCRLPEYAEIDMAIAMENLWLRCTELGLGGVWLGIAPIEERMRKVEKILHMPESLSAYAVFPFGYPDEERKQTDRFEEERIHRL